MVNRDKRKADAARRANRTVRSRTLLVMALLGVCTFGALFWKLFDLQIVQHNDLQAKAIKQQTRSTVITASRGTIYDRNGHPLAISATAETVFLDPKEIETYIEEQTEKGKPVRSKEYIARGLARLLELDQSDILERMEKNSRYEILKKRVDQDIADQIRQFLNGEIDEEGTQLTKKNDKGQSVLITDESKRPTTIRGVYMEPDSKRIYPNGTLAANVLGFVNGDNVGGVGLEAKYNSVLEGTAGLTITAKDNKNNDMLYQYEQYYDAQNGSNLVLTLDMNLQAYLEKGLEGMLTKYDAANGGTGTIIDVNTGAILAMASYPTYDPNSYGVVYDKKLQAKLDSEISAIDAKRSTYETEADYKNAIASARSSVTGTQWRNKCIDSTYEPGSTFKPVTLATALEEGLVDMNTTFTCTGSIRVQGWGKPIGCSRRSGHGVQDLKTATGNSCNPAFVTMGLKIGTQTYYKYLKSFGLMEKTGIDMIGEVAGIFADEKSFNSNIVSLASYAFGQTFNVTPIELIRAQAATVNGGYLYTPYIVEQVLDDSGAVVQQHETVPVRQVISEETSAKVRECLEYVVSHGGGKNGQVAGYRIGGKTGTADKTGTKDVVVSFMCFAPADDPQIMMLLTMDTPSRTTGTAVYGGTMVAPVASSIMSEVLPYLGIEPEYSASDLVGADATVPNVVSQTLEQAKTRLSNAGFTYKTVGDGETVTDQTPVGGAIVPNNATVILYMGTEKPDTLCTVPNVIGKSASEANKAITNAGLIMRASGTTSSSSGNVHVMSQGTAAGTEVAAGSVINVQFGDNTVLD